MHIVSTQDQGVHSAFTPPSSHYVAYVSPAPRRTRTSPDMAEGYRALGLEAWRTWLGSEKVAGVAGPSCQNTGPLVIERLLHSSWSTGGETQRVMSHSCSSGDSKAPGFTVWSYWFFSLNWEVSQKWRTTAAFRYLNILSDAKSGLIVILFIVVQPSVLY